MTIEDYHASRWIVEPLHLLDCCLVSNGAVAVIVSPRRCAKDMAQPPVYVHGYGPGPPRQRRAAPGSDCETETGGQDRRRDGPSRMAGMRTRRHRHLRAVRLLHLHRPGHARGLRLLQEGRGGPFVEDGRLGPGGSLPTNTGGGELSALLHVGHDAD